MPARKDGGMTFQPGSWTLDSFARLLAGMPALNDSDFFQSIRQSQIWKAHSESLDDLFEQFQTLSAVPISQWAQKNLGEAHTSTVFYPFSGPDFVFANLLFPRANNYILCGLESSGPIDWAVHLDKDRLPETLLGTVKCISHLDRKSVV